MTEAEAQAWAVVQGLSGRIVRVAALECWSGRPDHEIYADKQRDVFFCNQCDALPKSYINPSDVPHLFD